MDTYIIWPYFRTDYTVITHGMTKSKPRTSVLRPYHHTLRSLVAKNNTWMALKEPIVKRNSVTTVP